MVEVRRYYINLSNKKYEAIGSGFVWGLPPLDVPHCLFPTTELFSNTKYKCPLESLNTKPMLLHRELHLERKYHGLC
jgi:hypothetical protein